MPPTLTHRRLELLTALHRLLRRGAVTITDLAAALRISRTAVQQHLTVLRTMGLISEANGKHGDLTLTDEGRLALRIGIPIYGQIAAGPPILADQTPDDVTPNFETLLGFREGDFLLCVRGDSMQGIGVMDGHYVLVRPTSEVHDGEVAVVLVPGENAATLKRFYRFGEEVSLRSENPNHAMMTFHASEVLIQGRMIAHLGLAVSRRRE